MSENVPPTEDAAKRAAFVADLHAFADFLGRNSWAPLPYPQMQADLEASDVWDGGLAGLTRLRLIADALGEKPDEHTDDRTSVTHRFGVIEYRAITWHKSGRPVDEREAELARLRERIAELESTGRKPVVSDETIAEAHMAALCEDNERAKAAVVAGMRFGEHGRIANPNLARFLAHKEQKRRDAAHFIGLEESAKHYPADPTGLAYTRADTDADDPTPVSPARVPAHTGSVVDGDVLVTDEQGGAGA